MSDIVRGALQGANLSYGGVAAFAGQGYMSEALELVLHEAFVTLGLHRLEANIQPGNVGSLALVRRAGFELEGFSPRVPQDRRRLARSRALGTACRRRGLRGGVNVRGLVGTRRTDDGIERSG